MRSLKHCVRKQSGTYHDPMILPPLTEDQRKSLELLQAIISRLSTNGFLLKGWAVTLVSALLMFSGSSGQDRAAMLALLPAVIFWMLDAYLLNREQEYRRLFNLTRQGQWAAFDFQLTRITGGHWIRTAFNVTTLIFYLPLLLVVLAVAWEIV